MRFIVTIFRSVVQSRKMDLQNERFNAKIIPL